MAGAWQIEQAPIAQLFTQGLLAGMARADQRRQEDAANALALEETKARDSQVRAAMEQQRLDRAGAQNQAAQEAAAQRAQRTQQVRYNMAKAVAARPDLLPQFDAAIRRLSSGPNAQIDPFELGGVHVNDGSGNFVHQAPSAQEAQGIADEAQALGAQPERDATMTRDMLNFIERQRNPAFAVYQDSRTPKAKPSATAEEIAVMRAEKQAEKASRVARQGNADVDSLRHEWQGGQVYKDTTNLATAYKKVAAATPSAAGDMGLIFGYMKMLDPSSTVREGEYASAKNAGGIPDRIVNLYNGAKDGKILSPDQRAAFKSEAASIFDAQLERYNAQAEPLRRLAKQRGYNPDDVVFPLGLETLAPKKAPAPSQVAPEHVQQFGAEFDQMIGGAR